MDKIEIIDEYNPIKNYETIFQRVHRFIQNRKKDKKYDVYEIGKHLQQGNDELNSNNSFKNSMKSTSSYVNDIKKMSYSAIDIKLLTNSKNS